MKQLFSFSYPVLFGCLILFTGCDRSKEDNLFTVQVSNSTELDLKDVLFEIDLSDLKKPVPDSLVDRLVFISDISHAWQTADENRDGEPDKLLVLTDLAAGQTRKISASSAEMPASYPQRAQAEISVKTGGAWEGQVYQGGSFRNVDYLRVPPEHTDHSFYIRYEGPGWESDKVGYRFYLDWRNAIDIFGKKTGEMVLQDVGLDGFDSYHEPSDWGMDVLKVGESLGIGSVGIWLDGKANRVSETDSITCRIVASGPIRAEIETNYYGWMAGEVKTDLRSVLTIDAGSRLTLHKLSSTEELGNLCTGIVMDKNAAFIESDAGKDGWAYLGSYGAQSLAGDNLGMAVLFRSADLIEITEDALSKVVVLKPGDRNLEYYFLAAWEQEPGGITDQEGFVAYLEETLVRLDNPPLVSVEQ